jgi:RimJ/RimL family protein N-acetyltransferase
MVWVRPLDPHDLDRVGDWLSLEENYQWLDFGAGVQILSSLALAAMIKRDLHDLVVFGIGDEVEPVGLVGVSNIAPMFGSGTLWYILGDKSYEGRGYTSQAVRCMLDRAFGTLGLTSVNAWAVATNIGSIRVLEKCGFQRIGHQRKCHCIGESLIGRILFDKLADEHDTK